MPLEPPISEVHEGLSPRQTDDLVERVASSVHVPRASRLREFLLYVGKTSTRDGGLESREQDIGIKVFGRSPDYDRGADNIVRVNATELRKRIDHYFATEGADEPYIFQLPRGAYRLVFSSRAIASAVPEQPRAVPGVRLAV